MWALSIQAYGWLEQLRRKQQQNAEREMGGREAGWEKRWTQAMAKSGCAATKEETAVEREMTLLFYSQNKQRHDETMDRNCVCVSFFPAFVILQSNLFYLSFHPSIHFFRVSWFLLLVLYLQQRYFLLLCLLFLLARSFSLSWCSFCWFSHSFFFLLSRYLCDSIQNIAEELECHIKRNSFALTL